MGGRKHKDDAGKHRGKKGRRRDKDAPEPDAGAPPEPATPPQPDKAKRFGSWADFSLKLAGLLLVAGPIGYGVYAHFSQTYHVATADVRSTLRVTFGQLKTLPAAPLQCGPIDPNIPLNRVGLVVSLDQTFHYTGAPKVIASVLLTRRADARLVDVGNCSHILLTQKSGHSGALEFWLPAPAQNGSYEVTYRITTTSGPGGQTLLPFKPLACFSVKNRLIQHSASSNCDSVSWG
jgi:hypothetical protein